MEQLIKHLENMKSAVELAGAIGEVSLPVKVNFKTAFDDAIRLVKNISSNSMLADSLPLSRKEVRCDHCGKLICDDDTTT